GFTGSRTLATTGSLNVRNAGFVAARALGPTRPLDVRTASFMGARTLGPTRALVIRNAGFDAGAPRAPSRANCVRLARFTGGRAGGGIGGAIGVGQCEPFAATAGLAGGESDDLRGGALLADRGRWVARYRLGEGGRRSRLRLVDDHDQWGGIGVESRKPDNLTAAGGSTDHQETRE